MTKLLCKDTSSFTSWTSYFLGTRFYSTSITCTTFVGSLICYCFLCPSYCFHKINFNRNEYIFPFCTTTSSLCLFSTTSPSLLSLVTHRKELLELLENAIIVSLLWLISTLLTSLILLSPYELAPECFSKWVKSTKASLETLCTCLLLLIRIHPCLVIHFSFRIITKSLISSIKTSLNVLKLFTH